MPKWMIHRDEYEAATRAHARVEQLSILSRTEVLLELDVTEVQAAGADERVRMGGVLDVLITDDGVADAIYERNISYPDSLFLIAASIPANPAAPDECPQPESSTAIFSSG